MTYYVIQTVNGLEIVTDVPKNADVKFQSKHQELCLNWIQEQKYVLDMVDRFRERLFGGKK